MYLRTHTHTHTHTHIYIYIYIYIYICWPDAEPNNPFSLFTTQRCDGRLLQIIRDTYLMMLSVK